jgi:hypothetical protein
MPLSILRKASLAFLGNVLITCGVQGAWAADPDLLQPSLCGATSTEVSLSQVLNGQVCVRVNNPTAKRRVLIQIGVTGFHLRKPDGSASPVKVSVESPSNLPIAAFESVTLGVALQGPDKIQLRNILPSSYPGVIAITYTDADARPPVPSVVPFSLQLTVPGPRSAVTGITRWVYRDLPWTHVTNYRFEVPLSELTARPFDTRRYVLQTDRGHTAIVNPVVGDASAPVEDLIFAVSDLDKAGKYDGKIELAPGEGNAVTASINVKDCFIWPLLVMTLGVLTAQATKQSVKYMMGTADKKNQSLIRYLIASSDSEVFRSVAALVIAFLTAFKTLYIGKAFGTPSDYIDMFLSGTAVKLSVDLFAFGIVEAIRRKDRNASV